MSDHCLARKLHVVDVIRVSSQRERETWHLRFARRNLSQFEKGATAMSDSSSDLREPELLPSPMIPKTDRQETRGSKEEALEDRENSFETSEVPGPLESTSERRLGRTMTRQERHLWRGPRLVDLLEETERELIREALADARGNQTRAAEFLGISEARLRYKMKKYKVHRRTCDSAVLGAGSAELDSSYQKDGRGAQESSAWGGGDRVELVPDHGKAEARDREDGPVVTGDGCLAEQLRREFFRCKRCRGYFSLVLISPDVPVDDTPRGGSSGGSVGEHLTSDGQGVDDSPPSWTGLVRRCMRARDLVVRRGGEELVAVLPETGREEAKIVAERICETVFLSSSAMRERAEEKAGGRGLTCWVAPDQQRLTISVGVASYAGYEAESPEELLSQADFALYKARECGGNRVDVFTEDEGWQLFRAMLLAERRHGPQSEGDRMELRRD